MEWQKPYAFFLCGPSGSGKTGLRKRLLEDFPKSVVASSDDYIESTARATGATYMDTYLRLREEAQALFLQRIDFAAERSRPLIVDRTNLSPKVRRPLIALLAESHRLVALVPEFDPLSAEAQQMIIARGQARDDRPGPTVPSAILIEQCQAWVMPTDDEGFEWIEPAVGDPDWRFFEKIAEPASTPEP